MKNVIHTGTRLVHGIEVENVGVAKVDAAKDLSKVLTPAGREVVDATNLFAASEQFARQGRADETANASDEIESHRLNMITNPPTEAAKEGSAGKVDAERGCKE
jgi:hypothetical protein